MNNEDKVGFGLMLALTIFLTYTALGGKLFGNSACECVKIAEKWSAKGGGFIVVNPTEENKRLKQQMNRCELKFGKGGGWVARAKAECNN